MRHVSRRLLRVTAAGLALLASAAHALCTLSTSGLAFGSLDGVGPTAGRTTTGSISISCLAITSATSYRIGIGQTTTPGMTGRQMSNVLGGAGLAYDLYLDSSYGRAWTDALGSQATGTLQPNALLSASATHTIYGRLAATQGAIRPGAFLDSLLVTVTYDP